MSLEDVIARLEQASEGGRDLDYTIHNAVYGDRKRRTLSVSTAARPRPVHRLPARQGGG